MKRVTTKTVSTLHEEAATMATHKMNEYGEPTYEYNDSALALRMEAWTVVGVGVGALVGAPLGVTILGVVLGAVMGLSLGTISAISASERQIEQYA